MLQIGTKKKQPDKRRILQVSEQNNRVLPALMEYRLPQLMTER